MAAGGRAPDDGGMTGTAGQTGRRSGGRGSAVTAVAAAGSLLLAAGLVSCGRDAAGADTVLRDARSVSLVLADGSARPAHDGMTVPRGATVTTAADGSASLVTAGRTVLLGRQTAVTVLDGAREQLRQGLVMVDARRAPALRLEAGAATVSTPRGGLTRIERGALLRVGSFRGTAAVRAAGRRAHADVRELYQVQVPYGGLPGRVTALALTRDAWERRYALNLVTADIDLSDLAAGLDRDPASGSAVARVVPASFSTAAPPLAGESQGEQALAFVLARVARRDRPELAYPQVRQWRQGGGSWGVVAALAGADVAAVSAALDGLLTPAGGSIEAAAPGPLDLDVLLGGGGGTAPAAGAGPGSPVDPVPTAAATTRPGRPVPRPSARPSPPASPLPAAEPALVDAVVALLPTPAPAPPPGAATSPVPPLPLRPVLPPLPKQVGPGGLLGGLVDGLLGPAVPGLGRRGSVERAGPPSVVPRWP